MGSKCHAVEGRGECILWSKPCKCLKSLHIAQHELQRHRLYEQVSVGGSGGKAGKLWPTSWFLSLGRP